MRLRSIALVLLPLWLYGCGQKQYRGTIVIAVDGMDPGFVERHWDDLPSLKSLRDHGGYSRLATTNPPQSPVAWSTFITGLDPAEHGIFDFVQRDPATHEPYLSTNRTLPPRFRIPLGSWQIPLSSSRVLALRKGRAFWEAVSDHGIPVTILRLPANYPPSRAGYELSGMGTPDLRGTEGTFTFFSSAAVSGEREAPGGVIQRAQIVNGRAELPIEGPPNPFRRDDAPSHATLIIDIDPDRPYARLQAGKRLTILKQGEWSGWLKTEFPLVPHVSSVHGMFRVLLKQVHPDLELYVSPVNIDPEDPALPISTPRSYARETAQRIGEWPTLGIPEDTGALRAGVFDLPDFLRQTHMIFSDEQRILRDALNQFRGGLLIYYFSAIDQNSHMLFGRHDEQLLDFYRGIDAAIGETMRREPDASLIVLSDHGFTTFDRAIHLNRWLADHGFAGKAYALGLNGLYINDRRMLESLRHALLAFRDPANGRQVVTSVVPTDADTGNRAIAPDLIVGYAAGYRASWQTTLGEAPPREIEDNDDAWLADHCVDPSVVPGVLFANKPLKSKEPALRDMAVSLLAAYGVDRLPGMEGRDVF